MKSLVLNGYGFCNNSGSLAAIRRFIEIASLYSADVQIGEDCKAPRSRQARAVAVQMLDPHTKAVMLSIAQDYEKLAMRAKQRAKEPG